ncbi:MAG: bifunctional UDP-3-O-[3-hydroxymyristoyl] N-acetylglucosamine deacetylase/3-hydroxyacyl-ACP dehydratase [Gemmatimonadota bacterium]|nr:bifunctional UDP-3-O-[3-hydroxymyristoyl] N-acetylglucosamine deacetylase/3-hydroxyacyl-ACP dehydratase [Gemmatimonadota bacterium]
MSGPRQRTVSRPVTLEGCGLHSGEPASLTLSPADPGTGLRFRRTDLDGSPEVPATLDHVVGTELGTTLGSGEAKIMTVEHVLAALAAMRIDNASIDVSGPEVPIRDGSSADFIAALDDAGATEQEAEARVITVASPVSLTLSGGQSYVATAAQGLRISATIDFQHASIGRQFGSFLVDDEGFRAEIAPARTFGFMADAKALRARGLALGASLENTVVLDDAGVMNGGLRFHDEFLRHKVADVAGDLALLGARVDAHIVADRPSHTGNVALAKALAAHHLQASRPSLMDIARIMEVLPHRYPMLLVDRIVEFVDGERIVGIKNVTINEPFFQGHYPGHPIMPGVLIVEAMAQTGGLLLMEKVEAMGDKVVYFMTMDAVKFRRPVTPGDTLRLELEVVQMRREVCKMRGKAYVEGTLAAEAEFMAKVMDK